MFQLNQARALCLATVVLTFGICAPAAQAISNATTITFPAGATTVADDAEYFTRAWRDPLDGVGDHDVMQLDSPKCVFANHFTRYTDTCPNGAWCGRVRGDVSDPDLFLLHPGYTGSLHAGRDGNASPIDASVYTQLTIRMYIGTVGTSNPGMQLLWTNGTVADIGSDESRFGGTVFYRTYPGWNIYVIDLSTYASASAAAPYRGRLPWTGNISGLRLDPGLGDMNGQTVMIDWVRLTPKTSQTVRWTTNQTGNIRFKLQNAAGIAADDEVRMYQVQGSFGVARTVPASAGTFSLPISLPDGDWYVKAIAGADTSTPAGPWRRVEAPILNFTRPSFDSGERAGDWEMDTATSVKLAELTSSPLFQNGELRSSTDDTNPTNTCAGYWENPAINTVYPNGGVAIDTAKFRYVKVRMRVDGVPDVSYGWVARMVWANDGFSDPGVTGAVHLHDGWNEFVLDLWDRNNIATDDPNRSQWQARPSRTLFRLDPLETPERTSYVIDYIRLSAMETVQRGATFPIQYSLNGVTNATVQFFYDTDRNPANGRTPIAVRAAAFMAPALVNAGSLVHLPLVRSSPGNQPIVGGTSVQWDTANVPPGTYYVSADASNGPSTATWYSETPVIVR